MRATRIAFVNQKGGVGKTTSASNLAVAFAGLGQRCLLVDFDSQYNASSNLGLDGDDEKFVGRTVYEALAETIPVTRAIYEIMPNLDLMPASSDLAAADLELINVARREYRLQRMLKQVDRLEYDYILIDSPPNLGLSTINVLTAADVVYVPIQARKHSVKGFVRLTKTIDAVRGGDELNPNLRFGGCFLTMFNKQRSLDQRIQEDLAALPDTYPLLTTTIRETTVLAQAEDAEKSVFHFAPTSAAAEDYLSLAKEIIAKENQHRASQTKEKDHG